MSDPFVIATCNLTKTYKNNPSAPIVEPGKKGEWSWNAFAAIAEDCEMEEVRILETGEWKYVRLPLEKGKASKKGVTVWIIFSRKYSTMIKIHS